MDAAALRNRIRRDRGRAPDAADLSESDVLSGATCSTSPSWSGTRRTSTISRRARCRSTGARSPRGGSLTAPFDQLLLPAFDCHSTRRWSILLWRSLVAVVAFAVLVGSSPLCSDASLRSSSARARSDGGRVLDHGNARRAPVPQLPARTALHPHGDRVRRRSWNACSRSPRESEPRSLIVVARRGRLTSAPLLASVPRTRATRCEKQRSRSATRRRLRPGSTPTCHTPPISRSISDARSTS